MNNILKYYCKIFVIYLLICTITFMGAIFFHQNIINSLIVLILVIYSLYIMLIFKIENILNLSFALLLFLNILNYSALSKFQGVKIAYLRLPILFFALTIGVYNIKKERFKEILYKNRDFVLFFTILLLTSIFSINVYKSLFYSIWFIMSTLFLLIYFDNKNIMFKLLDINQIYYIVFGTIVLTSMIPLITHINNLNYRLFGLFNLRHIDAWSGVIVTQVILTKLIYRNKVIIFDYIMLILSIIVIILSQTRSAYIAILTIFLYYWIFFRKSDKLMTFSIIVLLIYFTLLTYSVLSGKHIPYYLGRFGNFLFHLSHNDVSNIRFDIWRDNINYFRRNPLSGIGFANAKNIYSYIEYTSAHWFAPHNTYLELLSETGILGGVSFIIILIKNIFKKMNNKLKKILFLNLLGPVIISIFESNLTPGQALFLPLWGCILLFRGRLSDIWNDDGIDK